ncbi:MAG TPA: glycoside hydrolase family 76 protein [Microbacteriaceae bacterium]
MSSNKRSSNKSASNKPLSRRALLSSGVGVAGAVILSGTTGWAANAATPALRSAAGAPPATGEVAILSAPRAEQSWSALAKYLLATDGSNLAYQNFPRQTGDNPYAYEWSHSQVHVGALDLLAMQPGNASRTRLAGIAAGQEHYWEPTSTSGMPGYASYLPAPYGTGGDLFYDDNEWVGLEKIQLYLMTHDEDALSRAEQIFSLVVSGWDTDASHADPGGVFWTQASWSQDRNTVSNMPAALLAARLYSATGRSDYLTWARRFYDWTNTYLLDTDSLYFDHVDLAGNVQKTKWSYNQGIPLAAAVALYKATGDARYLQHAKDVAEASYQYYVIDGNLSSQPIYFNSIYFKSLLLLSATTGDTKYYNAMSTYADQLWEQHRDSATGLISKDTPGVTQSLEQGAAVQIFAVLACHRHQWDMLY